MRNAIVVLASAVAFFFALAARASADAQCPWVTSYPAIFPATNPSQPMLLCDGSGNLDVNVKVGGGGGGGGSTVYNAAQGQGSQNGSYLGIVGWNALTGYSDAFPTITAGTTVPTGTSVPIFQGIGLNGAVNIAGTITAATSLPIVGVAGATPVPASIAAGTAGASSSTVYSVQGIAGGTNINVNCATGCANAQQISGPVSTSQTPLPVSGTVTANAGSGFNSGYVLGPAATPTPQPLATAAPGILIGGTDYAGAPNFNALAVNSNGALLPNANATAITVASAGNKTIPLNGAGGMSFTVTANAGTFAWFGLDASGTTGNILPCTNAGQLNQTGGGYGINNTTGTPSVICNTAGFNAVYFTATGGAATFSYTLTPNSYFTQLSTNGNIVGGATPTTGQASHNGLYVNSQTMVFNGSAGVGTGNWDPITECTNTATINVTAAGEVNLVAGVAGKSVRVCSYSFTFSGSSTPTVVFTDASTGSSCGGTITNFGQPFNAPSTPILMNSPPAASGAVFTTQSGHELCILGAGTVTAAGFLEYAQY